VLSSIYLFKMRRIVIFTQNSDRHHMVSHSSAEMFAIGVDDRDRQQQTRGKSSCARVSHFNILRLLNIAKTFAAEYYVKIK
jgi:hypothetical protein